MQLRLPVCLFLLFSIANGALSAEEIKLSEHLTIQKHPELEGQFVCDIGHATFTSPKDWSPHPSDKGTCVILAPKGEKAEEPTKSISIMVGTPQNETVKEMAESFAKVIKGNLAENPSKLDGEETARVKAIANPPKVFPVDTVFAYHGGRSFLLLGGAREKDSTTEALNEIVRTWKWK